MLRRNRRYIFYIDVLTAFHKAVVNMRNDVLKCGVCMHNYSLCHNGQKQSAGTTIEMPLLLACGHTFCAKCLNRLYVKNKGVRCPSCQVYTECFHGKNGIKGLCQNIFILGFLAFNNTTDFSKISALLESMHTKTVKASATGQHCSECMQHSASVNCVQCGVNICDECFTNIHGNSRVLQRHQAVPILKSAHNLSSLDCRAHHLLTDHYCVDDEVLICRECIEQDHASHTVSL